MSAGSRTLNALVLANDAIPNKRIALEVDKLDMSFKNNGFQGASVFVVIALLLLSDHGLVFDTWF